MSWTDERTDTLKSLWAEGLSASQIARQMGGVTRNAVIGKVHRLGLIGRADPSRPGERVARPKAERPRRPRKPVIVASNAVFEKAERPPVVIVPARAWEPLPGSTPRPWTERGRGCAWPVKVAGAEVQHSCCRPKKAGHPNYCPEHARLGVSEANAKAPRGSALARSMRRYA